MSYLLRLMVAPAAPVERAAFMGGARHTGRTSTRGPTADPQQRWVYRTGARVWELLAGDMDRAEIERALAEEFDAAGAPIGEEVHALIAALVDGRLVTERVDG